MLIFEVAAIGAYRLKIANNGFRSLHCGVEPDDPAEYLSTLIELEGDVEVLDDWSIELEMRIDLRPGIVVNSGKLWMNFRRSAKGGPREVSLLNLEPFCLHIFGHVVEPVTSVKDARNAVAENFEIGVLTENWVDSPQSTIDIVKPMEGLADREQINIAEVFSL